MKSMFKLMMNCLSLSCALRIRSARDVNGVLTVLAVFMWLWIQEPYYMFSQLI